MSGCELSQSKEKPDSASPGSRESQPPTLGEEDFTDALAYLDQLATTRFESVPGPHWKLRSPSEAAGRDTENIGPSGALRPLIKHAELRLGHRIADRYLLRGLLGTGSSGAVYGAVDEASQQPVAIKILHEGLEGSDEHVARFEREAHSASAIGSPHVIRVLDAGRHMDHTIYIAMELLDGQSLFYAIQEDSLTAEATLGVGIELLAGLAAAHEQGIVHRDVKPENIFLERLPNGLTRVKLLDFGIAKCIQGDSTSYSTADGFILGTPHYMSPELCAGEAATFEADLWATGAVLFHAFAGEPPFDDEHLGRLLGTIVQADAPSLGTHRPDLPKLLLSTIDRALKSNPAERWPSANDFREALEEALGQLSFSTL